ncbi:hypothetical protein [Georgenia thermotolerans]|nr:hypothetical protein [Georgenia thermotolerans]
MTPGVLGATVPPPAPVVSFDVDPLGFLFANIKEAAHGLASDLLPWLLTATQPDLSAGWFLEAYRISFAAAIFLWAVLLLWNVVRAARRLITGHELLESFTTYSVLFLGGAIYGPAAGWVVVRFFGALSQSLIDWAAGGSVTGAVANLTAMIDATEPSGVVGGVVVALLVMSLMLLGLLLVALVLVVAMVTLYFTGALVPLALAWLVDPAHRRTGTRMVLAWVAILAAKPLLFFLIGLTLRMTAAQTRWLSTDPRIEQLANLTAAAVAMILAALAPIALLSLRPAPAPDLPGTGGTTTAARTGPAPAGESSVARVARLQASRPLSLGGSATFDGTATLLPLLSNTVHGRPAPPEPGPVQRAAMAQQSREEGPDIPATPGGPEGTGTSPDGATGATAGGATPAGAPAVGAEAGPAGASAARADGPAPGGAGGAAPDATATAAVVHRHRKPGAAR